MSHDVEASWPILSPHGGGQTPSADLGQVVKSVNTIHPKNKRRRTRKKTSVQLPQSLQGKAAALCTKLRGVPTESIDPHDWNIWDEYAGIDDILNWSLNAFPDLTPRKEEIRNLVKRAYEMGSSVFGAESARKWADGFKIPRDSVERDRASLRLFNGDLVALIDAKRELLEPLRLNEARIRECISPDNPELEKLLYIAKGMELHPDPSYVGCSYANRPPLGATFLSASSAVEKMFYNDFWEEGLAIILTGEEMSKLDNLGFCLAGWAKKHGKACGRPITNGSGRRSMPPEQYLNGDVHKAQANAIYGKIEHPEIGDIARMILDFQRKTGHKWKDLRLWKYDLRKAYNLLTYCSEAVQHLCVELSDGDFLFFLAGVFGITGMPMAFQVITRAILFEAEKIIQGMMLQYVDDGFGVGHVDQYLEDREKMFSWLKRFLGDKAIEPSKSDEGMALDFIGYEVNLQDGRIYIAEKNVLKAFHAFNDIDLTPGARVRVSKMQGLASLGSRYGSIALIMRPFVREMYSSFTGKSDHVTYCLTAETIRVVRLFRFLFTMVALRRSDFSRPFYSFERRPHQFVCEYDASLSGVGVLFFRILNDGEEE